jgi:hypothetical protein
MNRIYREPLRRMGGLLSDDKPTQEHLHVPMVYESIPNEPLHWEYHILTRDMREYDAPTVEELNELGSQGWLLVSVLQSRQDANPDNWPMAMSPGEFGERMHTGRGVILYYFVRQKQS